MCNFRFGWTRLLLTLIALLPAPGAMAHEVPEPLFEVIVTCPPFWPGEGAIHREKGAPGVWDGPYAELIADDDGSVTLGSGGNLLLDCRYKGDRRLTVSVPDTKAECSYKPIPGMRKTKDLVCIATANHTLPVTVHVAETVTLQTALSGFSLRQPLDAIIALAEKQSLHTEVIYDPNKVPLRVIITGKGGELTTTTLSQGISRELLLSWPWDTGESPGSLFYSTVLRFGFKRGDSWVDNNSWPSADKQATLTLVPKNTNKPYSGPYDVRLTDGQSVE